MQRKTPLYTKYAYIIILLVTHVFTTKAHNTWDSSKYFDTSFLVKYNDVCQALIKEEGFEAVTFQTPDNLQLHGLLLERPNARYNVVACAGFYPGRKEGLAQLFQLLPDDCNLLLFDARGHGNSQGRFLSSLHNYGCNEYKDVLGALKFTHKRNKKDIILFGVCIGSFHAAHALLKLQEDPNEDKPQIKGLIFDSGMGSLNQVVHLPQKHIRAKILPAMLSKYYPGLSKKEIRTKPLCKTASCLLMSILYPVTLAFEPFFWWRDAQTNLFDKIDKIECPILFIHAKNDAYTYLKDTKALAAKAQHAHLWWIDQSEHALNQFKHKYEYRKQLCSFIKKVV